MCPQISLFVDPTVTIPVTPTQTEVPQKSIPDHYINFTGAENDTNVPIDVPVHLMTGNDIHVAHRAQVDTAAEASVTPFKDLLHDYKAYDDTFKCPIRLVAALDTNSKVQPEGEGYLHIPSRDPCSDNQSFIRVHCYYSLHLNSTLLNENDLYGDSKASSNNFTGMRMQKYNKTGNFTIRCHHRITTSRDIIIDGILDSDNKGMYTNPLIIPDLPSNHPCASIYTSSAFALQYDEEFISDVNKAVDTITHTWQKQQLQNAIDQRSYLQEIHKDTDTTFLDKLPFMTWIRDSTPVNAIRATTERMLWHQRLGHPSDQYLYTAHKFIDGVPKFKHFDPVLERCPTCIRSEQPKTPSTGTTKQASRPWQAFAIDLGFPG